MLPTPAAPGQLTSSTIMRLRQEVGPFSHHSREGVGTDVLEWGCCGLIRKLPSQELGLTLGGLCLTLVTLVDLVPRFWCMFRWACCRSAGSSCWATPSRRAPPPRCTMPALPSARCRTSTSPYIQFMNLPIDTKYIYSHTYGPLFLVPSSQDVLLV